MDLQIFTLPLMEYFIILVILETLGVSWALIVWVIWFFASKMKMTASLLTNYLIDQLKGVETIELSEEPTNLLVKPEEDGVVADIHEGTAEIFDETGEHSSQPTEELNPCHEVTSPAIKAGGHIEGGESLKWLNKVINKIWVGIFVPNITKERIMQLAGKEKELAKVLEVLEIKDMSLGLCSPEVSGIKVNTDNVDELSVDVALLYPGNANMTIGLRNSDININGRDLRFSLKVRVDLGKLYRNLSFPARPEIVLLDSPSFEAKGILGPILYAAQTVIKKFFGRPNSEHRVLKVYLPKEKGFSPHLPNPAGMLRVYLVEGKDLPITDKSIGQLFGGKGGSSDPYCILSVGRHKAKSNLVFKTLDPTWNFYCEFPVLEPEGLEGLQLVVNVMDWDKGVDDEKVGFGSVDLSNLDRDGKISDLWVGTCDENYSTGMVRLRIQWVPVVDYLPPPFPEPTSAGVLIICIKKITSSSLIIPMVSVRMFGKQEYTTAQGHKSSIWEFEEMLPVLVEDPREEWMEIRLYDCSQENISAANFITHVFFNEQRDAHRELQHKTCQKKYCLVAWIQMKVYDYFTAPVVEFKDYEMIGNKLRATIRLACRAAPLSKPGACITYPDEDEENDQSDTRTMRDTVSSTLTDTESSNLTDTESSYLTE